jgi:transcriptional regulator
MAPRQKNDILQGTLGLLILQTLSARGPMHGYALTQFIQQGSAELLRVEEGSLYPALHRMAQNGWIKGKLGVTERNRPARIYSITEAGKKELLAERESWARLTEGVTRVLRHA